jgi:uncharacterized protein
MRFVVWTGVEEWLAEAASIDLRDGGLSANGIQLGAHPTPYRVDYQLDASDGFVTRELELTAVGESWRRQLLVRHDGSGGWSAEVDGDGNPLGGAWDGELPDLSDALDIDIGFSPLTNSMPILRHELHRQEGSRDFVMAWVSVPDLRVSASKQRYEHLRSDEEGATVRFLEVEGDFSAELELDSDGLLAFYPALSRRVASEEMAAGTR